MPLARNGSSISIFSSPIGPCLRAISASPAIWSTSSRWVMRRMVKANGPEREPVEDRRQGKADERGGERAAEDDDERMDVHEHPEVAAHQNEGDEHDGSGSKTEPRCDIHGKLRPGTPPRAVPPSAKATLAGRA